MSESPRRGRVRPSDGLAVALVVAMFGVGALAYDAVPAEMVVHYTPPGGVYYGPETLPKAAGLFAIPAAGAVVFGVMRALPLIDGVAESLAPVRPYYQASIVLAVVCHCVGQAALLALNLA